MKPRSIRYREDAKRSGLWGAACIMAAVAFSTFAYYFRLCEMFWPAVTLAFAALGCLYGSVGKFLNMADKLKQAERESYWEHRRFMDRFSHVERV